MLAIFIPLATVATIFVISMVPIDLTVKVSVEAAP